MRHAARMYQAGMRKGAPLPPSPGLGSGGGSGGGGSGDPSNDAEIWVAICPPGTPPAEVRALYGSLDCARAKPFSGERKKSEIDSYVSWILADFSRSTGAAPWWWPKAAAWPLAPGWCAVVEAYLYDVSILGSEVIFWSESYCRPLVPIRTAPLGRPSMQPTSFTPAGRAASSSSLHRIARVRRQGVPSR